MKRNLTVFLVAINVLLVGLLAWMWVDPHGGLRAVHWQPPAPLRPDLGNLSATSVAREDADVGRFVAMQDRPLFYPGRRPAPVSRSGSAARGDPLDSIHLFGLFSGSEGGGAIVQVDGKSRLLKLSEALGDWTLKEIRPREVVFSRGAERRVVPLVQSKQASAAGSARQAGAFPPPFQGPGQAGGPGPGSMLGPGSFPAPGSASIPPPPVNTVPAAPPAANTSRPAPSTGNAAGAPVSNAKPAPSANPFVFGPSR